jgi:NADH:ubiquinone oxidoreductase subunit 4 (subunit M)
MTSRRGYQFVERVEWIPALGIAYHNAVDGFALPMLLLTGIVFFTAVLTCGSWNCGSRNSLPSYSCSWPVSSACS